MTDVNAADTPRRAQVLPPAMRQKMWQPGQSGNPSGKNAGFSECQAFCRERSKQSAERIWEMAETTKDERLAFLAHTWIYERAWGKAKDFNPKDEPDPNKPKFDPRLLSPQQLEIVQYALRLMVSATRAPGDPEPAETVIDRDDSVDDSVSEDGNVSSEVV